MRISFLTVIILLASQCCSSQSSGSDSRGIRLSLEAGYSIPMKESFRTNYDQSLFVGSIKFPMTLGVGIAYPLSASTDLLLSFDRRNYTLGSDNDTRIAVMPLLIGFQYRFSNQQIDLGKYSPYVGLNAGWYGAVFSTKILQTTQNGPDLVGVIDDSQNYSGYGMQINLGLDDPLNEHVSIGLNVRYDITSLGSIDDGGLGNLGGFLFGLKFSYGF